MREYQPYDALVTASKRYVDKYGHAKPTGRRRLNITARGYPEDKPLPVHLQAHPQRAEPRKLKGVLYSVARDPARDWVAFARKWEIDLRKTLKDNGKYRVDYRNNRTIGYTDDVGLAMAVARNFNGKVVLIG